MHAYNRYHNRITNEFWEHLVVTDWPNWGVIHDMEEWCVQCVGERHFQWQVKYPQSITHRCVWWFKNPHNAHMFELAWPQS